MLLWYVYGGYVVVLKVLTLFAPKPSSGTNGTATPRVTAYFAALNEEDVVVRRMENLLAQTYPADLLEIIVVSDGSSDRTVTLAQAVADAHPTRHIRVVHFDRNRGQAATQNYVAAVAGGDILLKTDADVEFPPNLIERMAAQFADDRTGVVGCVTKYREHDSSISNALSRYRQTEWEIRRLENRLGVMVKTDGACTAYRKSIWSEINEFEDVDQVAVLFARKHGMRAVHLHDAWCLDALYSRPRQELRARSRMTRKALLSISYRWKLSDVRRDPFFSFALVSHKVARFFSPVYLLIGLIGLMGIAAHYGVVMITCGVVVLVLVFALIADQLALPLLRRPAGLIWAFCVGNFGFLLGILGWLSGNKSGRYVPSRMVP